MYLVSRQFHEKMRAARRQVLARVTIDYSDPMGDQSITVQVSEQVYSWPNQVTDGVTVVSERWASLDGSWVLGESWHLMPETEQEALLYQVGWWGRQLADEEGHFEQPYPTLSVTHTPRSAHTLRLVGDSARGEYPVDFTLEFYDEDDVLLHQEVVKGNTEIEWSHQLPNPVPNVAKQVAMITRWSHHGRQVKIAEFFTSIQQTYEGQEIVALSLLEERETDDSLPVGSISSKELSLRLVNDGRFDPDNEASPLHGLLAPNRRVRAWLGTPTDVEVEEVYFVQGAAFGAEVTETVEEVGPTEWVPLGTFWSTDWDSPSDIPEATVRSRDRLEHLRKTDYRTSTVQQNVSAAALAQAILLDAGLGAHEWVIEDALQNVIFPWAWFPPVTHREALRILAEAALAVVYCDRDGRIRVGASPVVVPDPDSGPWYLQGAPFPAEALVQPTGYGIGPDDYFWLQAPSRQDHVANEIVVTARPIAPAPAPEEVYRSTPAITVPAGQTVTVTVQYQEPPVLSATAALDNPPQDVAIVDARYYAWGAVVDVENTGGSSAEVTLVVEGTRLVPQAGERVVLVDEASQTINGRLLYDFPVNHLIQTRTQALAVAQALLASAKDPRRDLKLEWRGNPALELGDLVSVVTDVARDRRSQYVVIRQELEWAGYLSARMTGRRLA